MTRRELFENLERGFSEVTVFWGCWTEVQLDQELTPAEVDEHLQEAGLQLD